MVGNSKVKHSQEDLKVLWVLSFVGKGPPLLSTFCLVLVFLCLWFTAPQVFSPWKCHSLEYFHAAQGAAQLVGFWTTVVENFMPAGACRNQAFWICSIAHIEHWMKLLTQSSCHLRWKKKSEMPSERFWSKMTTFWVEICSFPISVLVSQPP